MSGYNETNQGYYLGTPLVNQALFSMVLVFKEQTSFLRNFTCPYNMLAVCLRADGKDASVMTNFKTGEIYSTQENDIFMVPYNLPQQYHHTLRYEQLCIQFRLELFPGVDVFSGQDRIIIENSPALRRQAEEIFATEDRILMLSKCQAYALEFCHRHWPATYPLELEKMKYFSPVLDYIRTHANAHLEIGKLAQIMHMGDSTFTRKFHGLFKTTPKQFVQKELFHKASNLLMAKDATVKGTARELGFPSEFYFSYFFKKMSGLSPLEYKNTSVFNPNNKSQS